MPNKPKLPTWEKAKENGKRATAIIHGTKFFGYIYQGYFFHYVRYIGATKILLQHCESVKNVRPMSNPLKNFLGYAIDEGGPRCQRMKK